MRIVAALLFVSACASGPDSGPDPCTMDPLGCGMGSEFAIDPSCKNTEPLVIALGEGRDAFEPLAPNEPPTVHYGVQGGQHIELAFSIDNPDPSHRVFRAAFTLDSTAEGYQAAVREFVASDGFVDGDDGHLELAGLILFVDPGAVEDGGHLALEITDSCGRAASVDHPFDAP